MGREELEGDWMRKDGKGCDGGRMGSDRKVWEGMGILKM